MKHAIPLFGKVNVVILCCFIFCNTAKAQYVTIPDAAFVSWLQNNGYAGCINGNQLDTTCSTVLNATALSCSGVPIRDLTGIQYFKNLTGLACNGDSLTFLPALPDSLQYLDCNTNQLTNLPVLPSVMIQLICYTNPLHSLPILPPSLQSLYCAGNLLTSLPALPAAMTGLLCYSNQLSSLPALPASLTNIDCSGNQLTSLPALPVMLAALVCISNHLDSLPVLPVTLIRLWCNGNHLTSLPDLPPVLQSLDCSFNQLTNLPTLPTSLQSLNCYANLGISSLPDLPPALQALNCGFNQLVSLPVLPPALQSLRCDVNQLTSLPALPDSLAFLNCSYNNLTSIPELPDSLYTFECRNNANLSCLPQLKIVNYLNFVATSVTCLPNYGSVDSSIPPLNTVPLCGLFNPSGCPVFWDISGITYYDQNSNCRLDSVDIGINYTKVELESGGILLQQVFTGGQGYYSFRAPNNNYSIQVDTSNLPFTLLCLDSGYLKTSISATDSLSYSNNFAFKCRTVGFDVGAQSMVYDGANTRPASVITLHTIAGDMTELYGAHCAAGISGQVEINYTGPIIYLNPAPGALSPASVSGNTITWNVADFGTVNDYKAFNVMFSIDSFAIAHTPICFTANVTPDTGDNNLSNNTLHYCIAVITPHDPNEKEVYPSDSISESSSWLTYTIRFQNTGTASAINVRVTDTLDNSLAPSTFQLLAYSAKNLTQLFDNAVVFNFPNINLPDSATSDSASRGYVQYKIKLKDNLPIGTQIQNTADIYFDLNPAIVTNTTTNTITLPSGITTVADELTMRLYPNPAKDYVIVETGQSAIGGLLQVFDITGRELTKFQISYSKFQIPTTTFSGGVYFVKVSDSSGQSAVRKFVVE